MADLASKNPKFIELFLLFIFFFSVHIPNLIVNKSKNVPFLIGDDRYYKAMVVSIINDHDLFLENNIPKEWHFHGLLSSGKNKNLVPMHSIMMPILTVPFYYLFGDDGLLLFNLLNSFMILVFIFLINKQFHDSFISVTVSSLYCVASIFFAYAYSYSSDVFSTLIFLISVYFVLKHKFFSGVIFLGLSVFAKITNIIFFPFIFTFIFFAIFLQPKFSPTYLKKNESYKKILFFITLLFVFLISLLPIFLINKYLYGNFFTSGYQLSVIGLDSSNNFIINTHTSMFNQPFLKGVFQNLFDPLNGLIFTNPVLVFSFFGVFYCIKLKKLSPSLIFILSLSLMNFIFISKFDGWSNSHFSNRYLMIFIAFSSLFSGYYIKRLKTTIKNTV